MVMLVQCDKKQIKTGKLITLTIDQISIRNVMKNKLSKVLGHLCSVLNCKNFAMVTWSFNVDKQKLGCHLICEIKNIQEKIQFCWKIMFKKLFITPVFFNLFRV